MRSPSTDSTPLPELRLPIVLCCAAIPAAIAVLRPAAEAAALELRADPPSYLEDADGDFLPDVVEWSVLSDPLQGDTDGDGIGDFVEVVQFGSPITAGLAQAQDHETRVVVTLEEDPVLGEMVWVHYLFRFMGQAGGPIRFEPWIDAGGVQVPFSIPVGSPHVVIQQRVDPHEGTWLVMSTRLIQRAAFQAVMPCTLGADVGIGSLDLSVGSHVFTVDGDFCYLVPLGDRSTASGVATAPEFAVQQGSSRQNDRNPFANSNKLCVMQLRRIGGTAGAALYETHDPECEEALGLECSTKCPQSEGWTLILPDGLAPLTGN